MMDGFDDFLDAFNFPLENNVHVPETITLPAHRKETDDEGTGDALSTASTAPAGGEEKQEEVRDALDMLDGSSALLALFPLDIDDAARARRTTPSPEPLDRQRLRHCYYLHGLFEDRWLCSLSRASLGVFIYTHMHLCMLTHAQVRRN